MNEPTKPTESTEQNTEETCYELANDFSTPLLVIKLLLAGILACIFAKYYPFF